MHQVELSEVPMHSALRPLLDGADFHDTYRFPLSDPNLPALGIFLAAMAESPAWIDGLMWIRNKMVRMVGLKDLGGLGSFDPRKPVNSYRPGDRVGIFSVQENRESEVILGDKDKHLDVWLSVCKLPPDGNGQWAALTTVVKTKNALGRLYMRVVKPFHRLIAPTVLETYVARSVG